MPRKISRKCRCGKPRRPGQKDCLACHAAAQRRYRQSHPLTDEQRRKDNARSYAGVYLRRGKITKKPCEVCGLAAEMHHDDYDQPLRIRWLCREHHLHHHKGKAA